MQLEKMCTYFNTNEDLTNTKARSIMVDLKPQFLDEIRSDPTFGKLFNPNNFVFDNLGSGNNWAQGYHNGGLIVDNVLEAIRQEAEQCSRVHGF